MNRYIFSFAFLMCGVNQIQAQGIKSSQVQHIIVRGAQSGVNTKLRMISNSALDFTIRSSSVGGAEARVDGKDLIVTLNNVTANLEIQGPARETTVSWGHGEVIIDKWSAPIEVAGQNLQVKITGGEGPVKVYANHGKADIKGRRGAVTIEGAELNTNIEGNDGALWLGGRTGGVNVTGSKGNVEYSSFQGPLNIKDHMGSLDFEANSAALSLVKHHGSVRGTSNDGNITAKLADPVDFRVVTKDGRVTVSVPPGVGATVSAESKEADIVAPKSINVKRDEDRRVARGDLPGASKGFISVSTENALIRIKIE